MTTLALPRATTADFVALGKPRIVAFIVITVAAGFLLASAGAGPLALAHALIGTTLVAAGTNALNQLYERDVDALMRRTERRPLAAGRLSVAAGAAFGWGAGVMGISWLAWFANPVTAGLAALTLLSYVFLYTPLKRKSTLATLVGAVPGALPIVGGWTAAGGQLGPQPWALFWIMFLWQLPHFLAIAWIYRDDYRAGGLVMLGGDDPSGRLTGRMSLLFALALVPVSLAPTLIGLTGAVYFAGALVLGLLYTSAGAALSFATTDGRARRLFLTSIVYLPALLGVMVLDRLTA